jgi:hypothetical protein
MNPSSGALYFLVVAATTKLEVVKQLPARVYLTPQCRLYN